MISFKHTGDFSKTDDFLDRMKTDHLIKVLEEYGQKGVDALAEATPKDTGKTAASWEYDIKKTSRGLILRWNNTNFVDGVPIALVIQYGHATKNGGWVEGRDYINPTMAPIFEEMLEAILKEEKKIAKRSRRIKKYSAKAVNHVAKALKGGGE